MSGSHIACVFLIVGEVFGCKKAAFVTDEAIGLHGCGVKLDLDFDVLGDGLKGRSEFVDEDLAGFEFGVDVGVLPVSILCESLQFGILEVAHSKPQSGERNAALCFLFDEVFLAETFLVDNFLVFAFTFLALTFVLTPISFDVTR